MIVKRVSQQEADKIIHDSEIMSWSKTDQAQFTRPKVGRNIGGFTDKLFGIVSYHDFKDYEELHINVLKDYRGKLGGLFVKKALGLRSGKPLFAHIPGQYENVLKLAQANGFELWDINKTDQTINGEDVLIVTMRLN